MAGKNIYDENIINFGETFKFIRRNITLLSKFSAISLLLTSLTFINAKKIWTGQFQIVIEPTGNALGGGGSASTVELLLLNKVSDSSNSLQTEVEILKSPFVLLNVFEFIKKYDPSKSYKTQSFKSWVNNIDIKFTKNTSVLNIAYKDTNKKNIIPVLEKISDKYQNYSGSKRKKDILSSINYFDEQIKIYKKRSNLSNKKANDFAQKHDLIALRSNNNLAGAPNLGGLSIPVLTIESSRTEAANKIRKIDELIQMINSAKDNPESIINLSEIVNQTFQTSSTKTSSTKNIIDNINLQLVKLRTIYSENDQLIQDLLQRKKIYAKTLFKDTLEILEAQKESTKADLKSLERPIGVISQYKQLLRNASKDEVILAQLEDQLSFYSLENAKITDPWLLITNPTLSPLPLPTYKLRKLLLALFAGLIIGSLYKRLKEKINNKIIYENELQEIFKDVSIDTYNKSNKESWANKVRLTSIGLSNSHKGTLKMLLLDRENTKEASFLSELFNKNLDKLKIINTNSVTEVFEEKEFILYIESNISSKDEVKEISSNLDFQNKKIVKIIFIDE